MPTIRTRQFSLLDQILSEIDHGLRTVHGQLATTNRPYPAQDLDNNTLTDTERVQVGRLMRINHAGEVSAQGLYRGQAFVAKHSTTKAYLQESALEESDHLAWCTRRINALESRPSYLGGFWYWGSFAIGAFTGKASDQISLGFIKETEDQVIQHINEHLACLPVQDQADIAVLTQMRADEAQHGDAAARAGGAKLPLPMRLLIMPLLSKVMTRTSYYI